jgi:hypothetical protein
MFLNIFLYTTKIFDNNKFYLYLARINKMFLKNDIEKIFMNNSLIFIVNCLYLYINYFIWKKTNKNTSKTIIENLKNRRMTLIEADEDLLYIIK